MKYNKNAEFIFNWLRRETKYLCKINNTDV